MSVTKARGSGNPRENLTKRGFCVIVKKITKKLHYDYEP